MVLRKLRSSLLKFWRGLLSMSVKYRILLLYDNIEIGRNVSFGRMVSVRTSDGGRIIIRDNVRIENSCLMLAQKGAVIIGPGTYIGHGTHICAIERVEIGQNGLIAAYCVIRDMQHGMETGVTMAEQMQTAAPVVIGDDVWLGAHTVVTSGVAIGPGAIVGANSVVTKDIPTNTVVGGVPVKVLKTRSEDKNEGSA